MSSLCCLISSIPCVLWVIVADSPWISLNHYFCIYTTAIFWCIKNRIRNQMTDVCEWMFILFSGHKDLLALKCYQFNFELLKFLLKSACLLRTNEVYRLYQVSQVQSGLQCKIYRCNGISYIYKHHTECMRGSRGEMKIY